MADKLGITRPAYTAYELGSREPDYKTLINISNILDVSLDYLLKGESNEKVFQDEAKKVLNDRSLPPINLPIWYCERPAALRALRIICGKLRILYGLFSICLPPVILGF